MVIMLFLLFANLCSALWPFETVYDPALSSQLLQKIMLSLGLSAEEALLMSTSYLKDHKDLTDQTIMSEIEEGKFLEFVKEWKIGQFEEVLSSNAIYMAKILKNPPLPYQVLKSLKLSYEEFSSGKKSSKNDEPEASECAKGISLSYRI